MLIRIELVPEHGETGELDVVTTFAGAPMLYRGLKLGHPMTITCMDSADWPDGSGILLAPAGRIETVPGTAGA